MVIRRLFSSSTNATRDTAALTQSVEELGRRVEALEKQLALSERYHVNSFWRSLDRVYDHTLASRVLTCIVCGHSATRDGFDTRVGKCIFGGGRLERYGCPQCDCIFGAQKFLDLDEEMVGLDYQLLYSRYSEGDSTAAEIRTFHSLLPRTGGVYVNWGSGAWSRTVAQLRGEGWTVWGFEPTSSDKNSTFVITSKQAIPSPIDGILSNNVIEHFLDPVAQFRVFHSMLAPGARMAHSSPCYDYRYEFSRFHTMFLLGRSPEILAARTGFRVVDRVDDGDYKNVVFERNPG